MNSQKEQIHKQHHIDLLPGDAAPTVLVPGDPESVEVFAGLMDEAREVAHKREYLTYTGKKDGVAMNCTSSGIGPSPTAIGVEELIRIGSQNIVRVGVCGSIQDDVKAGEMVIVTAAVRGERATEEFISVDYPAVADHRIIRASIDACEKLGIKYHLGIVRTHDAFYLESQWTQGDVKARVQEWIDLGILAVDNETAPILVRASMNGVRAGAILLSGDPIYDGPKVDPKFEEHRKNLMMAGIETAKNLHEMGLD